MSKVLCLAMGVKVPRIRRLLFFSSIHFYPISGDQSRSPLTLLSAQRLEFLLATDCSWIPSHSFCNDLLLFSHPLAILNDSRPNSSHNALYPLSLIPGTHFSHKFWVERGFFHTGLCISGHVCDCWVASRSGPKAFLSTTPSGVQGYS